MMDSLLPSEIARLVLGYLQEQKCEGAAKTFLETSPLLQECHLVAQRGGKYSTKVGGLNLVDILEKYCAVNAMVQEKLSRITDSDTLKQCNDLLDQLRYLLEGSSTRGHRFVVNISVPSQNSPSAPFVSPIVSGSNRKRHHSSSERVKRISKSLSSMMDKNPQSITQNCDTVEATPLESLPGHKSSIKQNDLERQTNTNDKYMNKSDSTMPDSKISQFDVPPSSAINTQHVEPHLISPGKINKHNNYKDQATEPIPVIEPSQLVQTPSKCTAATNTDELMNYCTAEVQTGPSDIIESESDINDEPIENLSILTKKLLQRTELHERIAENINKAIMPVETSFREINLCENQNDANMSLLNDFDNTIKSIVQATETDPVFEDFLKEIFKVGETDTSPDEDSDTRNNQVLNQGINLQNNNIMRADSNCEIEEPMKLNEQKTNGSEVPLKHRLRSSSKSQNANIEEEDKDTNSILENQNAEAIMSIVNVVTGKRNALANIEESNKAAPIEPLVEPLQENPVAYERPLDVEMETEIKKSEEKVKPPKLTKKTKRLRPPKPPVSPKLLPPEPEVVPTLILCSEKDVESLIQSQDSRSYLPIAPKPNEDPLPLVSDDGPKIFLRTVNVPRHLVNPAMIEASCASIGSNPQILQMLQQQVGSPQKAVGGGESIVNSAASDQIVLPIVVTDKKQHFIDGSSTTAVAKGDQIALPNVVADKKQHFIEDGSTTTVATSDPIVLPIVVADNKQHFIDGGSTTAVTATTSHISLSTESITLYGGENDTSAMKVAPISSMPIISLDDSSINLSTGSGLSPFFKDHVIGGDLIEVESIKKDEEKDTEKIRVQESEKGLEETKVVADTPMDVEDDCPESVVLEVEPDEEELAANAVREISEEKKECVKSNNGASTEIITKHTPRTLLRSRAKNNRLSLSTPRRRNSHVRALDFNTPVKIGTAKKVPQSCTRSKSVCRSGLFKSPPFTGATPNVNINFLPESQRTVKRVRTVSPVKPIIYPEVPIATRSPAPKLQGNWAKYTGIGMILGDTSTSESSPDKTPQQDLLAPDPSPIPNALEDSIEDHKEEVDEMPSTKVEKPIIEKKSWDSDLRKIVGAQVTEEENKPKTRSRRVSTRKKASSTNTIETNATNETHAEAKTKDKKKINDVKKSESDNKRFKTDNNSVKEVDDEANTTINVGTDTAHKTEITPPNAPPVSKKSHLEVSHTSKSNVENDKNVKNSNTSKNSPINITTARFPDMLDLETPRKTEVTFYVPPTPRLLVTPGEGLKTNRPKTDLKIKDCVDTPEFPMTPCIVVTPKIVEEDSEKKPSPYYEPEENESIKPKEIVVEKVVVQVQEATTVMIQKNVVELQENKSLEITEYGVIEEKTNATEQENQLIFEDNFNKIVRESSIERVNVNISSNTNSCTNSDDDSSDSDSSTSSSSSGSSTSSSSSDSSATSSPTKSIDQKATDVASEISQESPLTKSVIQESSLLACQNNPEPKHATKTLINEATRIVTKNSPESSPIKSVSQEIPNVSSLSFRKDLSMTESEIDSPDNLVQRFPKINQEEKLRLEAKYHENSPTKVVSVIQESSDDKVKETPAKNGNVMEAMIAETPSVTDTERALRRDSLTNLTSKISAFISTSKSDQLTVTSEESCISSTGKSGIKIKSVQIIKANDITKEVSEMLQSGVQKNQRLAVTQRPAVLSNIATDAKLSQQLEEKRLRTLAKLNGLKSPRLSGKGKKPIPIKKNVETEKIVSSTSDNQKNTAKRQLENNKLTCNSVKNIEKSKIDNVKLADKNEQVKESKKSKGKASPRKKFVLIDQDKTEGTNNETNFKQVETETLENVAKEISSTGTVVVANAENIKIPFKSKVDQVKRDLFSDDEMNDQRTTRSQSARRTTTDTQKNNNIDDNQEANTLLNSSKEKLPGVLECLQLIPANKSDQESHDLSFKSDDSSGFSNTQTHVLDVSFIYDESVPIKKRKRKYSTSELQSKYTFSFPEEGVAHILTLTDWTELFKMTPRYVKPKAASSPKRSPTKVKKCGAKIVENLPLANFSSNSASNAKSSKLDEKKKKTCKRKAVEKSQKEDQMVDKKVKVDPQALLNKIKVDEFLKLVHE